MKPLMISPSPQSPPPIRRISQEEPRRQGGSPSRSRFRSRPRPVVGRREVFALAIGCIGFIALTIRLYLSSERLRQRHFLHGRTEEETQQQQQGSTTSVAELVIIVSTSINFLSHFFTILTNTWLTASMLYVSFMETTASGSEMTTINTKTAATTTISTPMTPALPPPVFLAITVSIVIVGLVYHIALRHLVELPPGILPVLSDHGVHTVTPILMIVWWLVFEAPVRKLRWSDSLWTIPWPMLYVTYILFRAIVLDEQFYPYPFLNLPVIGTKQLFFNVTCLSTAFIVLGTFLVGMNHVLYDHCKNDSELDRDGISLYETKTKRTWKNWKNETRSAVSKKVTWSRTIQFSKRYCTVSLHHGIVSIDHNFFLKKIQYFLNNDQICLELLTCWHPLKLTKLVIRKKRMKHLTTVKIVFETYFVCMSVCLSTIATYDDNFNNINQRQTTQFTPSSRWRRDSRQATQPWVFSQLPYNFSSYYML